MIESNEINKKANVMVPSQLNPLKHLSQSVYSPAHELDP